MRIEPIRAQQGVARLRDEWRGLQAQCPNATPFQTWEWNQAWMRHFGARKRPLLLLFRSDAGELLGLAPLYVSFHLGTPLRRLAWMGTGTGDYLDILALSEHAEAVTDALRNFLNDELRGWDMADLQQLRADSLLIQKTEVRSQKTEVRGQKTEVRSQKSGGRSQKTEIAESVLAMEPCPYLELPGTWDEVTARLGKKMRSNLGYYDRLLLKTYPDASYSLADAGSVQDGMTALFELHQKRWNARWLPGVLGNRRVQAFHREVAAQFLEQGWLRLHLLTIEGAIRSVLYCFHYNGKTHYYLGGFAPELGKYSLGTLLTGHAIRHAIAENSAEFDFLRGNESYKYRWLPQERINQRLLLLPAREGLGELPGKAGLALNRMERYVEHRAKAFAEQRKTKVKPSSEVSP